MSRPALIQLFLIIFVGFFSATATAAPIRALIVDGRNNHKWQETTPVLKQELERTGIFTVDVATAPANIEEMKDFRPHFSKYNVVILNYTDFGNGLEWSHGTMQDIVNYTAFGKGVEWSHRTMQDFDKYVAAGGGVVAYHAALSAFPQWQEYNQMIGLGGWGKRDQHAGFYVYFKNGKEIKDNSPGIVGHHGTQHSFMIVIRDSHHPITQGLPTCWMHGKDELYDSLRGPAQHLTILATAYSAPSSGGTGRDEPVLFTIRYKKGRVVDITLGHDAKAASAVDFAVIFQRSAEWAATGRVTQHIPKDFPTAAVAPSCGN